MTRIEDCCYRCERCSVRVCAEDDISPGEADSICRSCWDDLLNKHDSLGFAAEWSAIAQNDDELGAWWASALTNEGRTR